jgi:hypothetical protein
MYQFTRRNSKPFDSFHSLHSWAPLRVLHLGFCDLGLKGGLLLGRLRKSVLGKAVIDGQSLMCS